MGPIITVVAMIILIIITMIIVILCGYGSFSDDCSNETTDYLYYEVGNCKMVLK
jgi:bacteriorhodopsin